MIEDKKELSIDSLRKRVRNVKNLTENEVGFSSNLNEDFYIATHLMHDVVKNIGVQVEASMLKDGLVGAAWMVLMMTYSSEEQKIIATDICDVLSQNKSTTSRIVESLIEKNFLVRNPDAEDRRKVYLHITTDGKQYVQSKFKSHSAYQSSLWEGVDIAVLLPQLIKFWSNTVKAKIEIGGV